LDRRNFLRYGLGVAGAGLFSLGLGDLAFLEGKITTSTSSTTTTGSSSFSAVSSLPDYQAFLTWLNSVSAPFKGKSLNISLEAEFGPYSLQLIDGDFANATGINDQYNILSYSLQLQDVALMFDTKSDTYDLFSLDVENLGLFPGSCISPLELAEQYPDLTYPEIDFADFNQNCWDRIATFPPDLSGGAGGNSPATVQVLPFDTPTLVLFYRKDIYNKLGLTPPATWDEHFDNCQTIMTSGLAPFGSASMCGTDISVVYEYQAHLSSFGGQLWDIDGNTIVPVMNNDQAIAALEDLVRFEPYSDVGSSYFTWDDVFNSVAHESAAQALLWNGYAEWMNDSQRSRVPGLIGYAPLPAGPEGSFSPYAGSGVGVSQYSANPQMAWLWAQWATAKGTQEAMILDEYHVYPTRASVVESAPVASALQTSALEIASLTNQIWQSNSVVTLIGFPLWLSASTILEVKLNEAWTGSLTPANALAECQTQIEQSVGTITF
jgi:ABC-type glycerol-3-phosphate transport system substrate-binding protein